MISFDQLMKGFGVVTVMNACIYKLKDGYSYFGSSCGHKASGVNGLDKTAWEYTGETLDTLKIANLTQEGPTKTVSGGQYNNTLIKYGKTMTAEMQDALGRADTLVRFFGCEYASGSGTKEYSYTETIIGDGSQTVFYVMNGKVPADQIATATWESDGGTIQAKEQADGELAGYVKITFGTAPALGAHTVTCSYSIATASSGRLSVTDKFPGAFAIEGTTFFVDQKTGETLPVFIFIPQFLPDAILTLTQDAEGDAAVFDLNGSVNVTSIAENGESRNIFYEIREESFFGEHE